MTITAPPRTEPLWRQALTGISQLPRRNAERPQRASALPDMLAEAVNAYLQALEDQRTSWADPTALVATLTLTQQRRPRRRFALLPHSVVKLQALLRREHQHLANRLPDGSGRCGHCAGTGRSHDSW